MGLFRSKRYDRNRILADATRAEKQGKTRRAIALYREVLGAEPNNHEIHCKLAPLLVARRERAAAWQSYKQAVEHLVRNQQYDAAADMLREASRGLPRQPGVFATLATVELKRGREADAWEALRKGRAQLRGRRSRRQAIQLLERARRLRPDDVETAVDLARLLGRVGRRRDALRLLDALAQRRIAEGDLRRVRVLAFRLSPTPARAWRMVRGADLRSRLVSEAS